VNQYGKSLRVLRGPIANPSASLRTSARVLAALWALLFAAGCSSVVPLAKAPLYDRLGGQAGVARVVDRYVDALASDPRTNRSFDRVNLRRVKDKLALFLCSSTGGRCTYDDDDMKTVHAGMNIREAEFYAGVELLVNILNDEHVAAREKNELLAILAPAKNDVVTR